MQLNDVLIFLFFFNQEYSTTLPAIKSDQQGDKTWLISLLRLKNLELISYSKDLQRHSNSLLLQSMILNHPAPC